MLHMSRTPEGKLRTLLHREDHPSLVLRAAQPSAGWCNNCCDAHALPCAIQLPSAHHCWHRHSGALSSCWPVPSSTHAAGLLQQQQHRLTRHRSSCSCRGCHCKYSRGSARILQLASKQPHVLEELQAVSSTMRHCLAVQRPRASVTDMQQSQSRQVWAEKCRWCCDLPSCWMTTTAVTDTKNCSTAQSWRAGSNAILRCH
jgi:hypothetical protein